MRPMVHKQTRLSFSLFCSKRVWHFVLNNAIRPYLSDYSIYIEHYAVKFNYLSGENIRLGIWCEEEYQRLLAQKSDIYFKRFFSTNQLPSRTLELPVYGIFLPFPSNTIQHGLYELEGISALSEEFSAIILEALPENEIDDEAIITLAFYLNLGLARIQTAQQGQFNLTNNISVADDSIITEKFLKDKYEAHKLVLQEIYEDVLIKDRNTIMKDLPWLERWLTVCDNQFVHQNSTELAKTGVEISYYINKHLGITGNMQRILNYFLNSILSECQNN